MLQDNLARPQSSAHPSTASPSPTDDTGWRRSPTKDDNVEPWRLGEWMIPAAARFVHLIDFVCTVYKLICLILVQKIVYNDERDL